MSIVCQVSAVHKFHQLLIQDVDAFLIGPLTVNATGDLRHSEWSKKSARGDVVFEMTSDNGAWVNLNHRTVTPIIPTASPEIATDEGVRRVWVSWREKWFKHQGTLNLSLRSVGMAFYWGTSHAVPDTLFRAEWDQKDCVSRASDAGHPHWQFSNTPSSRVHFGMAGWTCADTAPDCWQLFPSSDSVVREWARKTLEYAKSQLEQYPPQYSKTTSDWSESPPRAPDSLR